MLLICQRYAFTTQSHRNTMSSDVNRAVINLLLAEKVYLAAPTTLPSGLKT